MDHKYQTQSLILMPPSLDTSVRQWEFGFQQVSVLHQYDLGTRWYERFDFGVAIDATKAQI